MRLLMHIKKLEMQKEKLRLNSKKEENNYKFINYLTFFLCVNPNFGDWGLGIGDWGLGIGDWAQSPIPNPQSPIPNPQSPSFLKNAIHNFILIQNIII